jgi:GntR family transcriptional regulator of arabinose operon
MGDINVPKYAQLKKEIQSWIYTGHLKQNEQLPSEHELSRLFDMSRQTVRQAVGEMVQEGLLYRIQGKGTFCSGMVGKKYKDIPTVAIMTTYISDYIFPLIVRGAEALLRKNGYRLLLFSTDNDKAKERECLEMILSQPISGLIVEPTKSAEGNPNLSYYLSLESQGIPYLMINERYSELECPSIKLDDELGGYRAAYHLIEAGHRRIAGFFKTDDLQGVNRLKGFLRAHRECKLPFMTESIVQYKSEEKFDIPLQRAIELLGSEERPTAFVCYNDELAVRMLEIVRQAELNVPEDLSIVGYDDSFLATATEVKLTSLAHPKIEMGRQAAEVLVQIIEGRVSSESVGTVMIKPELIIRESSNKRR